MKHFNNAGPCVENMHYVIDPLVRIDVESMEMLIEQQRYFVLHAPRQTGKTTCLLALMHHLNRQGKYRALYVNIEAAQAARGDVEEGVSAMCNVMANTAKLYLQDHNLHQWLYQGEGASAPATSRFSALLMQWALHDPQQPESPRPS